MNIILFESGRGIPIYLECCLKQLRLFNPDIPVYIITDKINLNCGLFKKYNIQPFDKDLYICNEVHRRIHIEKVHRLISYYNKRPNNFWVITTTRLVYIEMFMLKHKLEDVYHFESDVLLYYDLKDHNYKFKSLYKNLAITTADDIHSMTGLLYIKNGASLALMTQFFIDILRKYGRTGLAAKYRWIRPNNVLNEMKLIRLYELHKGQEYLANLPISPVGKYSEWYELFDSIFDCSWWGIYVGGDFSINPKEKRMNGYLWKTLINDPECGVIWKYDDKKRKVPYLHYDNKLIKINNLHIASKYLELYTS